MPAGLRYRGLWCVVSLFLCATNNARGHTPSETFLTLFLTPTNVGGHWDVALRDLRQGLTPGADPRAVTPPDLEQRQEALALDTIARLRVNADGTNLALKVTDYFPVTLQHGEYVRVEFSAAALPVATANLELDAGALFAIDPSMHGFLRLERERVGHTDSVVFNAAQPRHTFRLAAAPDFWREWQTYVKEGVQHIWVGFDHLLFLLALLLPAVLNRDSGQWDAVDRFQPACLNVLKIITAFTVAHSLTLSLAALDVVRVPARLVEPAIAASVAVAASNNLWLWLGPRGWGVAFGFGLVHGFGFANVLAELGLNKATLVVALVGFNVGVELGQMAIVLVFLPVAFLLRRSAFYRVAILRFGSAAVVLIALAWMFERLLTVR